MKRDHWLLTLIIIGLILWQTATPAKTFAWLGCPYGKINDPYPGLCELYLDTNNNQICDRSEPSPKSPADQPVLGAKEIRQRDLEINFWFIFSPVSLYFLHWYLTNKTDLGQKIALFSRAGFRYFWNLSLLITFIPTAISGLGLGAGVKNQALLFWHNNLGTSFTIIGFVHLLTHLRYYQKNWKTLKQKSKASADKIKTN